MLGVPVVGPYREVENLCIIRLGTYKDYGQCFFAWRLIFPSFSKQALTFF